MDHSWRDWLTSGRLKFVAVARGCSPPHQPLSKCAGVAKDTLQVYRWLSWKCKQGGGEEWGWASGDQGLLSTVVWPWRGHLCSSHSDSLAVNEKFCWSGLWGSFSAKHFTIVSPSPWLEKSSEHMFRGWWVTSVALMSICAWSFLEREDPRPRVTSHSPKVLWVRIGSNSYIS